MDYYTLRAAAAVLVPAAGALLLVPARALVGVEEASLLEEARPQGSFRRLADGGAIQKKRLERRQRAAVERSGEGGAAGVGDLGVAEVERLDS